MHFENPHQPKPTVFLFLLLSVYRDPVVLFRDERVILWQAEASSLRAERQTETLLWLKGEDSETTVLDSADVFKTE